MLLMFQYSSLLLSFFHPFFVSMAQIEFNKKEHTIEVGVRIFADDLEKAIRKSNSGKFDLMNAKEKAKSEKLLEDYVSNHLKINTDGKVVQLKFVGFEAEAGSIWTYFEVPGIASIKTLEVTNTLLHEYQNKQINFIYVKANGKEETQKLDYPDSYKKFIL